MRQITQEVSLSLAVQGRMEIMMALGVVPEMGIENQKASLGAEELNA